MPELGLTATNSYSMVVLVEGNGCRGSCAGLDCCCACRNSGLSLTAAVLAGRFAGLVVVVGLGTRR